MSDIHEERDILHQTQVPYPMSPFGHSPTCRQDGHRQDAIVEKTSATRFESHLCDTLSIESLIDQLHTFRLLHSSTSTVRYHALLFHSTIAKPSFQSELLSTFVAMAWPKGRPFMTNNEKKKRASEGAKQKKLEDEQKAARVQEVEKKRTAKLQPLILKLCLSKTGGHHWLVLGINTPGADRLTCV